MKTEKTTKENKLKITGKQAKSGDQILQLYVNNKTLVNEKNVYAASRNLKKFQPIVEEIAEFLHDEKIKRAIEGKDGELLKNADGSYKFGRKETAELEVIYRKKLKQEYEFDPFIFPENDEIKNLENVLFTCDLSFLLANYNYNIAE